MLSILAYVLSEFNLVFFFFFQAEDGLRATSVTGVQTCALPISQILTNVEMQEQLPRWITSLKTKSSIELRDCGDLDILEIPSNPESSAQQSAQELLNTAEGWRNAWSSQNIEEYFSYYSPNFKPEKKNHLNSGKSTNVRS